MPHTLVVATNNRHKLEEIRSILTLPGWTLLALDQFAGVPELREDGATYADNARSKAETVARFSGKTALGDDSGLEIDALDGAPGLYSARYAGVGVTFAENRNKVLAGLSGVPWERRLATFRCVLALVEPDGSCAFADGAIRGVITLEERGAEGFGYDPIFFVPEFGRTLAEMSPAEKNRISHRARALAQMRQILEQRNVAGRR